MKNDINEDYDIYVARRKQLVAELKEMKITNPEVLNAIEHTPRHLFIDQSLLAFAYENKAYQIGCGQTISQPYTVALQTQLLEPRAGEKVLEIGTGSGYQSAILAEMGMNLFSVERQYTLYSIAKTRLNNLGYNNVHCYFSDGFTGLPEIAPFDKIIVTAGSASLPQALMHQLKIGGIMVIPMGQQQNMYIYKIKRISKADFRSEKIENCAFVPMISGVESQPL
jgi:protein-L-isoaspartate(D-aspartate) O-methyltransferase